MHIILDFVAVAVLVAGYRFARQSGPSWRMGYIGFATLAALRGMRLLAIQLREHIAHPPRFDFLCFWLDGRVAQHPGLPGLDQHRTLGDRDKVRDHSDRTKFPGGTATGAKKIGMDHQPAL